MKCIYHLLYSLSAVSPCFPQCRSLCCYWSAGLGANFEQKPLHAIVCIVDSRQIDRQICIVDSRYQICYVYSVQQIDKQICMYSVQQIVDMQCVVDKQICIVARLRFLVITPSPPQRMCYLWPAHCSQHLTDTRPDIERWRHSECRTDRQCHLNPQNYVRLSG